MSDNSRIGFVGDFLKPDWKNAGKVHDWRNYIHEGVQAIWDTFTDAQKEALARQADEMASKEDWE